MMEKFKSTFPFDIGALLDKELQARIRRNRSYSLRAFAKDLALDPSDLSKIIRGKKKIGIALLKKISLKLGFDESVFSIKLPEITKEYSQVNLNEYEMLSNWRHYALLELIKLDDFDSSEDYIANKIGITKSEASEICDRLEFIGLLKKEDGEFLDNTLGYSTTTQVEFTKPALKNMQKGILSSAIEALDNTPIECRDQSSITVASSKEKIREAKILIKKFRRQLCEFLEETEKKDEVFNLSISLYPITCSKGKE